MAVSPDLQARLQNSEFRGRRLNRRSGVSESTGIRIILDLDEVTLVDVEVVRFLSDCEDGAIILVHCPLFVREWIIRERVEGAQT